ncbi:MAG TPA: metalloregulator ArsR/SmtB family transcription factor [Candidatus Limnocylindria bacterium]|jgi:rhodanese-related sulfurtransferase|nr:metalloregulator ArsR/SmtB family transcription factor [Candidatus Limnocylindria bacterium]
MADRVFKERLYEQFARVGTALGSRQRLELLDLLAQAPRHVDALAAELETPVANVSQHLQALRAARLVETERQGTKVIYRLADDSVLGLWLALRTVADRRLSEVSQVVEEYATDRDPSEQLSRDELEAKLPRGRHTLVDVRPTLEYESGHLQGAISIPIEQLAKRLSTLPRERRIIVYCRGTYCQFADRAVSILRRKGFDAIRLEGGWPEWRAEGRPTEKG